MPERTRVDGVDYTPEGILQLRDDAIKVRDEALKQLPDSAHFVVWLSHAIALLADYAEMRKAEDESRV